MTSKQYITRSEYYQLTGLLIIARKHNQTLKELEAAVRTITGEQSDIGHSADAVYDLNCSNVDDLLAKLGLIVKDDAA